MDIGPVLMEAGFCGWRLLWTHLSSEQILEVACAPRAQQGCSCAPQTGKGTARKSEAADVRCSVHTGHLGDIAHTYPQPTLCDACCPAPMGPVQTGPPAGTSSPPWAGATVSGLVVAMAMPIISPRSRSA